MNVNNYFTPAQKTCLSGRDPVTCLAEGSGEAGWTHAGEVGDPIEALSSVQTGLRLALVYVCREHIRTLLKDPRYT